MSKETYKEKSARLEAALVRIHSAYFDLAEKDFSTELYKNLDDAVFNSMSDSLKRHLSLAVKRKSDRQKAELERINKLCGSTAISKLAED